MNPRAFTLAEVQNPALLLTRLNQLIARPLTNIPGTIDPPTQLPDNSIPGSKIVDLDIPTVKIADSAIIAQKIANLQIGATKLDGTAIQNHGVFLWSFEELPSDWLVRVTEAGVQSVVQGAGVAGGNVYQTTGLTWRAWPGKIPFDPSKLYRMRVRVRQTTASNNGAADRFYCGVEGIAADGTTLVNTVGSNSPSSQHYIVASAVPANGWTLGAWQELTGWFKGTAATGGSSPSTNPATPKPLHQNVRYFRPLFIANYNGGDGTVQIDYLAIDVFDEDGLVRTYLGLNVDGVVAANKVVAASILASAVETDKLAANAVTAAKIAANAVESDKIAANAVIAGKIAAGAINAASLIVDGTITGAKLVAGTITADKIEIGATVLQRTPTIIVARKSSSASGAEATSRLQALGYSVTESLAATVATCRGYDIVVIDCSAWSIDEHDAFIQQLLADGQKVWTAGNDTTAGAFFVTSVEAASPVGTAQTNGQRHPLCTGWTTYPTDSDSGTRITGIVSYARGIGNYTANANAIPIVEVPHPSGGLLVHGPRFGLTGASADQFLKNVVWWLVGNGTRAGAGEITGVYIADGTVTANHIASISLAVIQAVVSQLSAITADVGTLTAGQLRNSGNTNGILLSGTRPGGWTKYLDFTATGNNPFMFLGSALTLTANGNLTLTGTATLATLTMGAMGSATSDASWLQRARLQSSASGSSIGAGKRIELLDGDLTLRQNSAGSENVQAVLGSFTRTQATLTDRFDDSWSATTDTITSTVLNDWQASTTGTINTIDDTTGNNTHLPAYDGNYKVRCKITCQVTKDSGVTGGSGQARARLYVDRGLGAGYEDKGIVGTVTQTGVGTSSATVELTVNLASVSTTANAVKFKLIAEVQKFGDPGTEASNEAVATVGFDTGAGYDRVAWKTASGGTNLARRGLFLGKESAKPHFSLEPLGSGEIPTTADLAEGEFFYDGVAHKFKYFDGTNIITL